MHATVIEEELANVNAPFPAAREGRWFPAKMYDSNWLLWIHIHGDLRGDGDRAHMWRNLMSYPSLRCHVFARYAYPFHNLGTGWLRKDNLEGKSAFLGINNPFFLDSPGTSEPHADEALPLFKPNCVFAAHVSCRQRPCPRPDWIRVDVNGGGGCHRLLTELLSGRE